MAKRGSLSTFVAEKPQRAEKPVPAEASATEKDRRGQTLRLNQQAWLQLKVLAAESGIPSHALLIEAINDLFQKHGKPPIA